MKKSVVWIWRDFEDDYCIGHLKPKWIDYRWFGSSDEYYCFRIFERLFPFFKMPPKSLGKITNTANTLTFEVVETK